ncbi:MAG: DNA modification methylase [Planctomycetes bacterium]|nr:DNA modification methylase [Planctomycetota bacterium]
MKIEMRPLSAIIPYPGNPRVNDGAIDAVAASIREFGFRNAIVVDKDGVIVAGHTRLAAAKKLGLTEAPVHVAVDLSPEQARAFRLADNKTSELADWDYDLLPIELAALRDNDFDLSILGFNGEELSRYLAPKETGNAESGDGPREADESEPSAEAISRRGEAYRLGNHRLVCGDNGSAEDMLKLAGGERFDLCFTSPPYLQQRDYSAAKSKVADWDALMKGAFANLPMKEDGQILVNLGLLHRDKEWQPYWRDWIEAMREAGWLRFGLYCWHQGDGMPGASNGRLASCFELIFHFCRNTRGPYKIKPCKRAGEINSGAGQRNRDGTIGTFTAAGEAVQDFKVPDAVISVNRAHGITAANAGYDHPAAFPWQLPGELINAYTQPGESVLDQFCGSGSTIIACERSGRRGFGIEIDPAYCDVIRKRWAWLAHGHDCDWQALTPAIGA